MASRSTQTNHTPRRSWRRRGHATEVPPAFQTRMPWASPFAGLGVAHAAYSTGHCSCVEAHPHRSPDCGQRPTPRMSVTAAGVPRARITQGGCYDWVLSGLLRCAAGRARPQRSTGPSFALSLLTSFRARDTKRLDSVVVLELNKTALSRQVGRTRRPTRTRKFSCGDCRYTDIS